MTKDENIWGNVRFVLLLGFSVLLIFIILGKYVFDVPMKESSDLIKDINHSEMVFEKQKEYGKRSKVIWNQIDSLDFNVHQVQRMDEIYTQNSMSSKFLFGILASKTLKIQFDIREELNSLIRNNELIEKDLEECKANI